jgi:putative hydrolase of the HAD superfamily
MERAMMPDATTCEERVQDVPPFKAVLFGLDDTLYPKRQYVVSGLRAVSDYVHTLYGVDVYGTLVKCYDEGHGEDVLRIGLLRHFRDVEESLLRRLSYVYALHRPQIVPFEDVGTALAYFSLHGIGMGILAAGQPSVQRRKIAQLGLEPLVDGVLYTGDLSEAEPEDRHSEDPFRIMALQFGLEFPDMAYVADDPLTDFVVPKRLGMTTVRIRRVGGEHSRDDIPSPLHAPDITISSLDTLVNSFLQRAVL